MAKRKRVTSKRKGKNTFLKIPRKTRRSLIAGAITIPITFGLLSKASSKLGDVGAGIEKGVSGFSK